MKFLAKASDAVQRFATKKYIIPIFALFIIITGAMDRGPISSAALKELSGGQGMLDMNYFGYSWQLVYGMLDTIGLAGRQIYAKLLGLDFIFAIVFMLFQSLMLTALLKRAQVQGTLRLLNLLPFLRSGLDFIENGFILTIILNYPLQMPLAVELSSAVTVLKFITYGIIIASLFLLGAYTSFKPGKSKTRLGKWSENAV